MPVTRLHRGRHPERRKQKNGKGPCDCECFRMNGNLLARAGRGERTRHRLPQYLSTIVRTRNSYSARIWSPLSIPGHL